MSWWIARLAGSFLLIASADLAMADEQASLAAKSVDVELLLAADVSTSMDANEKTLQRNGFVAAFRNPLVVQAIKRGSLGRIVVTYVEWGGPTGQRVVVPWTMIDDEKSAADFAARLAETTPGRLRNGTAIGDALLFAWGQFALNGYEGLRRVIDISGDGISGRGVELALAREAVLAGGITINGLPISYRQSKEIASVENDSIPPMGLTAYYDSEVIGGPDAFVEPVTALGMYGDAIRRKLIREVAGTRRDGVRTAER